MPKVLKLTPKRANLERRVLVSVSTLAPIKDPRLHTQTRGFRESQVSQFLIYYDDMNRKRRHMQEKDMLVVTAYYFVVTDTGFIIIAA